MGREETRAGAKMDGASTRENPVLKHPLDISRPLDARCRRGADAKAETV